MGREGVRYGGHHHLYGGAAFLWTGEMPFIVDAVPQITRSLMLFFIEWVNVARREGSTS